MKFTRREMANLGLFGVGLPVLASAASVANSVTKVPVSNSVTLPALFAAELPARMDLSRTLVEKALAQGATIIEKRIYNAPVEFGTNSLVPLFSEGAVYLFAFASLQVRQKAWDRWNAGSAPTPGLRALSIYGLLGHTGT